MSNRPSLMFSILGLAAGALAQAPDASQLKSSNWQERNATAIALAENPETVAADVLQVLQADWDDGIPDMWAWNSAVGLGTSSREPRSATLKSAGESVTNQYESSKPERLTTKEQLTVPWHPHQLAVWVLCQRGANAAMPRLKPTLSTLRWQERLPRELIPVLESICNKPTDRDEYHDARKALQHAHN